MSNAATANDVVYEEVATCFRVFILYIFQLIYFKVGRLRHVTNLICLLFWSHFKAFQKGVPTLWKRFFFTGWQYENSFLLKTKQRVLTLLSYPKFQEKWLQTPIVLAAVSIELISSFCFLRLSPVSILTNSDVWSQRGFWDIWDLNTATQYSSIFILLFSLNRCFYGVSIKIVSKCLKQKLLKSTFPFQLLSLKIKCKCRSNEFSFPMAFIIIIVNN